MYKTGYMPKHLHFIAIGGAAMHNLALALQHNGYVITGSDDEIQEPSRTRLAQAGLLPGKEGWYPEKITPALDGVVLGMHARKDNPELLQAIQSGLPVYSFPEFLYEHAKKKERIVIGGSHGKTTITSMILHVLKKQNLDFDYLVGAKVEGFDTMVRLSDAPRIVLEGDEYLSSPVDLRPKFHLYRATVGLISGIAWDHVNVFPTYESYLEQFRAFASNIPDEGKLIYCSADEEVSRIVMQSQSKAQKIAYGIPNYEIVNGVTYLITPERTYPVGVFGEHNLMNLEGARQICQVLGIGEVEFYRSIGDFRGAARRLELLAKNETVAIYRDFAHSPSKLKATIHAARQQYPRRELIACMELHTFSSLNSDFLSQYAGTMDEADEPIVYFDPHTIEHKKLPPLSEDAVRHAFQNSGIRIFTDPEKLQKHLERNRRNDAVFLMMSSGNFSGMDTVKLAGVIAGEDALVRSIR